jgi:uncharacterized protein YidB (DUF937 family)
VISNSPTAKLWNISVRRSAFNKADTATSSTRGIGSGQNQPITPDQLHQALGPQAVDNLSRLTGVAAADLISELSRVLPGDR